MIPGGIGIPSLSSARSAALHTMGLEAGRKLGSYEILSAVGRGGMGEVWKARDTKLGREIAIKTLPEEFTHDEARLARFEREAKLLASLNHPNIAAIYGLEEFSGTRFLVLEFVDGETLADRLIRGPIPLEESLKLAMQIAEALESAHEKGVIHRDLKPANIKVTSDSKVKVLDFGLAKVLRTQSANLSDAATNVTVSAPGMILGTAAYMSPEQARSKEADRASDVWAFGCVLYEMLTARRVFEGETVAEILGGVLKTHPNWQWLPAGTPEGIRRLLRRCLEKDPNVRFRDVRDARLEINDVLSGTLQDGGVARISAARWPRLVWSTVLALVTLIAALGVRAFRTVPTAPEARLEIQTPPTRDAGSLAISPDGQKIVFSAMSEGRSQLWLRSLDSVLPQALAGTEQAFSPFWAPDSRSIGFFADTSLKRVDINGGSVQTLAHAQSPIGGAWNRDGTIIFSTNPGRPIFRIPAKGGDLVAVTPFKAPQQEGQGFPQFLPDARHFLYFVTGSPEARGVYIGQLDGLETHRLFDSDLPAVYASTGHLLFTRQGTLFAQEFDPGRLELHGNPFPVAERLGPLAALSASAAGPIVYRTPLGGGDQRQFVWIDRSGKEVNKVVYPDTAGIGPSLSPDGRRIAVFSYKDGNMDIWLFEVQRHAWNRFTFDSGNDIFPIWSPDGRRIVFSSNRIGGLMHLYQKLLSGPPGSEKLLLPSPRIEFASDWSSDGRFLLYDSTDPKSGNWDIWALPLEGEPKPFEVVRTDFNEQSGQFSPDGKWIAYQSDRSGKVEIYVQRFSGPGDGVLVSTNGGTQARWNPKGKELFYIGTDDRLMAIPLHFASNGQTVEPGTPLGLFRANLPPNARQEYMVSPDGQSFVMNSAPERTGASPVTVILNWKPKS